MHPLTATLADAGDAVRMEVIEGRGAISVGRDAAAPVPNELVRSLIRRSSAFDV